MNIMKIVRNRGWFRAIIAFCLIGLVAACSGGGDKAEGEKVVNIASIIAPKNGVTEYIGAVSQIQRDGWLDKALAEKGWKVNWVPVPPAVGGPVVNEGFAARSIDMAAYGDLPAIIAMAGGVDLRLVTSGGSGSNIYLAVGKDAKVQSLADLKGKRVALHRGRPWEAGFARYVQSEGLSVDDFKIINMNAIAGTAALTSGKVDAVVLIQAEAYVLEERGLGRILWSTRDAPESWKMMAGTFARKDFIDQHPEIVQIVVTAFVRQAHWASQEENRETVLGWGTAFGAPLSAVQKDSDNSRLPWKERYSPIAGPVLQEHFDFVAEYAFSTGLTRTKVDTSKLIDQSYVRHALKELKLENWWQTPPAS